MCTALGITQRIGRPSKYIGRRLFACRCDAQLNACSWLQPRQKLPVEQQKLSLDLESLDIGASLTVLTGSKHV
jgi:hypothetical protein